MKVVKIQNAVQPQFGTKVLMTPQVVRRISGNTANFRMQISELENNGIDDVLLLYMSADFKLGAEAYRNLDGKLLGTYEAVETPFWTAPEKSGRNGKYVNIVDVYKEVTKYVYSPDRRYGVKAKNWQGYIPGI